MDGGGRLMMYWDISKPLSYNALFNFIVGSRGCGKTYGCKQWAIKDFLKSGSQFVYVRRYKQELKNIKTFFMDISQAFPAHEFTVKGNEFMIDGKTAGYAIALSTSKILKSTAYPLVNKIIFDEFILDKGVYHYLPDEVTTFLELYSTIARLRDVRVFFISNALTMTNPYFDYFNIGLPYGKNISCKNDVLIEMVKAAEYTQTAHQTRFGKLIQGTAYSAYAMDNEFLRDNNTFVEKRSPTARYYFTIRYNSNDYGVWMDSPNGIIHISRDVDNSCVIKFALTTEDHEANTIFTKGRKSVYLYNLCEWYKNGAVRFGSIRVKNEIMQALRLILY